MYIYIHTYQAAMISNQSDLSDGTSLHSCMHVGIAHSLFFWHTPSHSTNPPSPRLPPHALALSHTLSHRETRREIIVADAGGSSSLNPAPQSCSGARTYAPAPRTCVVSVNVIAMHRCA